MTIFATAILAAVFLGLTVWCDTRITKEVGPNQFTNDGPAQACFVVAVVMAIVSVGLALAQLA